MDHEYWLCRAAHLIGKFPRHARREIPVLLGEELREHILQYSPGRRDGVYQILLQAAADHCVHWTLLGWYLFYEAQRHLRQGDPTDHD